MSANEPLGAGAWRQVFRHVKPRHADPVVGHPVIDVDAVRHAEVVAPINAGGEYDVRDGAVAFLRQQAIGRNSRRSCSPIFPLTQTSRVFRSCRHGDGPKTEA